MRCLLTGSTWTPEEAEEFGGTDTVPAFDVLVRDEFAGDAAGGLTQFADQLEFRCDDGTLTIVREQ
jgi:hypothetical protein